MVIGVVMKVSLELLEDPTVVIVLVTSSVVWAKVIINSSVVVSMVLWVVCGSLHSALVESSEVGFTGFRMPVDPFVVVSEGLVESNTVVYPKACWFFSSRIQSASWIIGNMESEGKIEKKHIIHYLL